MLILSSLLLSTSAYAQIGSDVDSTLRSQEVLAYSTAGTNSYKSTSDWKTYKTLNILGWSALGVGIPTTFYGLNGAGLGNIYSGNAGIFIPVTIVGGALTLSSIPLLIIAHRYKQKALNSAYSIGLSEIKTPTYFGRPLHTPTITLAINF